MGSVVFSSQASWPGLDLGYISSN